MRGRRGSANSYDHAADVYKDDALRAEDQNQTITVNGAGSLFLFHWFEGVVDTLWTSYNKESRDATTAPSSADLLSSPLLNSMFDDFDLLTIAPLTALSSTTSVDESRERTSAQHNQQTMSDNNDDDDPFRNLFPFGWLEHTASALEHPYNLEVGNMTTLPPLLIVASTAPSTASSSVSTLEATREGASLHNRVIVAVDVLGNVVSVQLRFCFVLFILYIVATRRLTACTTACLFSCRAV